MAAVGLEMGPEPPKIFVVSFMDSIEALLEREEERTVVKPASSADDNGSVVLAKILVSGSGL
jgi:hypothetical protein